MTDEISKDVLIKMYLLRDGLKATRTELARALNVKRDYLDKHIVFLTSQNILLETSEINCGVRGRSAIMYSYNKLNFQKYLKNDPLIALFLKDIFKLDFNLSLLDD